MPRRRAEAPQALLPHAARARRGGTPARMNSPVRDKPSIKQMRRRHLSVDGLERSSGRNASSSRITPSNIMSPTRNQPESRTEVSPGARAHNQPLQRANAPPDRTPPPRERPRLESLTADQRTSKQVCAFTTQSGASEHAW